MKAIITGITGQDGAQDSLLSRQHIGDVGQGPGDSADRGEHPFTRAAQAEARATQAEIHTAELLNSTSWRMTAPLCWVGGMARHLSPGALKPQLKTVLQHAALYIGRRPWFKRVVLSVLEHFPGLKSRLFRVVTGIVVAYAGPAPNVPTELAHLNPRARQVYADLKAAIVRRSEENGCSDSAGGVRLLATLDQLDSVLKEVQAAAAISDDEMRRVFSTFHMKFPFDLPKDPYSDEYRDRQFEFYRYLAGKSYDKANEVSVFDEKAAAVKPFPFSTGSPQTVGHQLIAIGHIIRTMNLPAGSSILEFGPGWGNTTLSLARMGYNVTAVDIEQKFVNLIGERARHKGLDIEVIHGDFQFVQTVDRIWDAVLFFECFHHCADHHSLVAALDRIVAPGGKIVFAAEPITDDLPMPWGFRLDGESLWAIRQNGWCELGFQETYFRDLMERNDWMLSKHVCSETPWGTVFVAARRVQ